MTGPVAPGRAFELDRFQVEAIAALDRGENVLVAAPTGSGKTVVAEHAVALALASGSKAFYTAPIKALSNQKYRDLVEVHGADRVGLLTGDTSRNPDAPVVVMTTEVLRNMLYRRAPALEGLRWVVLDEVHFLQDEYRGPVWEEVMIHLAPGVGLVCLSATVSNADELGEWITTVRGPTAVVLEERRPVRLTNHFMVESRDRDEIVMIPTLVGGKPNRKGQQYDAASPGGQQRGRQRGRQRRPFATPRRLEVVDRLAAEGLLPAIYFIFSRAACDDAVRSCTSAGLRLTSTDERSRIREIVEAHTAGVDDADLAVLGYDRWLHALESGVAAHHAGMVPPFKEAVEACFVEGLVRVVFATETLALGINMPARTVVIEKLTKYNGEGHEFLTPAQYTQLTGRAGRRGIDPEGHAVVLWSPFVPFGSVADLVASRRFVLTSAFRPTYNMAANLVRRYDPDQAHRLLNLSFAQYQADRAVVRAEIELAQRTTELDTARRALTDAAGEEAADELLSELDDGAGPRGRPAPRRTPGWSPRSPRSCPDRSWSSRRAAAQPRRARASSCRWRTGVGPSGCRCSPPIAACGRCGPPRSPAHPTSSGRSASPCPSPRRARPTRPRWPSGWRAQLRGPDAGEMAVSGSAGGRPGGGGPPRRDVDPAEVQRLARRVRRLEAGVAAVERRARQRNESLARRFDQLLQLLDAWGYLEGWELTDKGERLAGVYHECDLLITEALAEGVFDGLDPASLAGVVSCVTYEHRSAAPPPEPWFPSARARSRVHRLIQLAAEIGVDEQAARLTPTRTPDPGFFALAHAWAAGTDLDVVLEDEELSPGDFVRNVKQLIDLLRQVAAAAPTPELRDTARDAVDRLLRGVVLVSTLAPDDRDGPADQPGDPSGDPVGDTPE